MKKFSKMVLVLPLTIATSLLSCKKQVEPISSQIPSYQMSTSNLIEHFDGYEIWQAPWEIYDEVFNNDPDPDANWQQLNELLYYSGYAIKEMILDPNYSQLKDDIVNHLNDDSELILHDFFSQHPHYQTRAATLVQNAYSVDYNDLLNTKFPYDSLEYSAAIHVLENTLEYQSSGDVVVAMGIELDGPNHTEAELYAEDYIPAFYIQSDNVSTETVIGFDDESGDYKTAGIPFLAIAIVAVPVTVYFLWRTTFDVDPYEFTGDGTTFWQNCEFSEELTCSEARFDERFQKKRHESNYYEV